MTVADGFEVTVAAAEPLVRQPVAIDFDDRGRLWVIQYLQYPNPAGLKRVKVDRYSRTVYDRVPEPPPRGPVGADRLTILEDTDGDGRADRAKDFIGGLNLASGFAFGHGGVFVLQVPYLLFYADRNGDDVPDGDPEVCLTGFGMEDAHSVANSLMFGPDGWLYGCQGSTVTATIGGIEFQQGVWRYHPITKKFELFCEGGGNSWGLDFDARGNLLYSTNQGPFRMLHAVQGGYYWKSFGKHGALHNPYAYGWIDHVPHKNFVGGHVTVGGMIYQSDLLPAKFRGRYVAGDLLGHAVYWNDLEREGSSFRSVQGEPLLVANDAWFASSDVTIGPDGAVYVADWCDQRMAHPDPDADWDRSNGRVYRVGVKNPGVRFAHTPAFGEMSSRKLVEVLPDSNQWVVRRARNELARRRDPGVIEPLRKMLGGEQALEALWALYVSGGFDEVTALKALAHDNADVRRWAVRLVGDDGDATEELLGRLCDLAAREKDVNVRSQLASAARRLPVASNLQIVTGLLSRDEDVDDPHIPLLLWWAIEPQAVMERERVLLNAMATIDSKLATKSIQPRLMRRWAAEGTAACLDACGRLLRAHPAGALVEGFNEGRAENPSVKAPLELVEALKSFWREDTSDVAVIRALASVDFAPAKERVDQLALDAKAPVGTRVAMIRLVKSPAVLVELLSANQPPEVQVAAIDAGAADADVIARFAAMAEPVRQRAAEVLLSRKESAGKLLAVVDQGRIDAKLISVEQIRQVALHQDAPLDALVRKHWGNVRGPTPEEKLADVRRLNNDLRAFNGDAKAGHVIFQKNCGICHRMYDEGSDVGPDLTHANRKDRDYLLVSIVDPSTVVRAEHMGYVIDTTDGQVLTGLIAEQTPSAVTLKNASNVRTAVERSKIKQMRESPVSLMPEELITKMKPQEVRDLFAYLQSDHPVAAGD